MKQFMLNLKLFTVKTFGKTKTLNYSTVSKDEPH